MNFAASLKHRPFALLCTGQSISSLGDSLSRIALSWWVLEKTGLAAIMGTVLILLFAPLLLFVLLSGVAVDRLPRGQVMFVSDRLRGGLSVVIARLAYSQLLEVWHIFLASVLFGLVSAFFQPAYTAIVPQIIPAELLPSANSLKSLSFQFANVAGPALGAILVKYRWRDWYGSVVSARPAAPAYPGAGLSSNPFPDLVNGPTHTVFGSEGGFQTQGIEAVFRGACQAL